jgi:hypothetical protein
MIETSPQTYPSPVEVRFGGAVELGVVPLARIGDGAIHALELRLFRRGISGSAATGSVIRIPVARLRQVIDALAHLADQLEAPR